eukprot:gene4823-21143_t
MERYILTKSADEYILGRKCSSNETSPGRAASFSQYSSRLLLKEEELWLAARAICLTEICLEYKANSSEAASDSSCCSRNTGNGNKKKINLPKLQLPTFNGNPLEWVTFWDSFQSAIGLDDELNDVDKFNIDGKIPEELRVTISPNLSDDEGSWDLEEVLDLFGKEVQLREKYVVSNESRGVSISSSWRKPNAREFMSSRQHQPSTVSALYANQGGLK